MTLLGMSLDWAAIAQFITGFATFAIAWVAFQHSRKSFQLQSITLYISHWRELNRLFLESERARSARARLAGKSDSEFEDVNSLIFIYINQALLAYYAWRFGAMPHNEMEAEFEAIWNTVLPFRARTHEFLHSESFPCRFVQMFEKAAPSDQAYRA